MAPARTINEKIKNEIIGVALVALALLCLAGLYVLDLGYISTAASIGAVGRLLAGFLKTLTGEGKYLFPLILGAWGLRLIAGGKVKDSRPRLLGGILLFLTFLSALHQPYLNSASYKDILAMGLTGQGGGLIGAVVSIIFKSVFGRVGTWIVLVALGIISFLLVTGVSLTRMTARLIRVCSASFHIIKGWLVAFLFTEVDEEEGEEPKAPVKKNRKVKERERSVPQEREVIPVVINQPPEPPALPIVRTTAGEDAPVEAKIYPESPVPPGGEEEKKIRRRPPRVNLQAEDNAAVKEEGGNPSAEAVPYVLPPLSLLTRPVRVKNPRLEKDITDRIKILEDTLDSFGVKVKVTQVSCGPTVTRYEVQPAPGVKVSRIVSLADDIALSLAAAQVRIEAPIPGKAAVGIEVPNKEIAVVHLREVLEDPAFLESNSKLTVALGKDIAGNPVIADLAKMPHLLIAGTTGSGKSVCLNALICSLLFKATPQELKLLMIDPKMVELTQYNGIPHLLAPVVSQPKKAATALQWMVSEMEKRYELFAGAGVKDITRYNRLMQKENNGQGALPLVVVLIDELADLMMVAPADVEDAICRLAQMARAAGIHLVVATQRPSVDVITGLIKANISSRIAFAVSSQVDSRTILDMAGAEKLLGRGDMLFLPIGASKPIRVQGVYVSDREVEDLVTYVKQQGRPEYDPNFLKGEEVAGETGEAEDELFPAAVRVILETGQASISMLQRRLRIGYTRAARLMDMMEARGFVGGHEGTKARAILTSWEEYEELFGHKEG
ncbi:FtsK/SpoIIIE family DNA translocase [Neomoorella humiferrea]|uniref:DNA translocase SpoIIIE n=1 Tax=Neomoorella humiferrea TaxID=676965 RepID=A0A2T0AXC7_9FIRM|nr:DNA translocase FtsK [Moorella humiferrea]PRR75472.1 DNA translocase SpoIIIE [Moorella humiferrea]